jgi:hypothetical protein
VRAGGLRMSMRFMGPEESGVVAVSRTPGLCLVGVFAVGASLSDAASSSEGGGEEADGSGKGGYSGNNGVGVPLESPANMGFSGFLHFSLHLEAAAILATMTLHASSKWSFSHVGQLRIVTCQQSM